LIDIKFSGLMHVGILKNICVNFHCKTTCNERVSVFYATFDCTLLFWKKCCSRHAAKCCSIQN